MVVFAALRVRCLIVLLVLNTRPNVQGNIGHTFPRYQVIKLSKARSVQAEVGGSIKAEACNPATIPLA